MIRVSRESGNELLGYVVMSANGEYYYKSLAAGPFNEGDSLIAFVVRVDSYDGYHDCSVMNFHGKLIGTEFHELPGESELPSAVVDSIIRELWSKILED